MVIWTGLVIFRARSELRGQHKIQGLHRSYLAPYEIEDGWVIDPRTTGLKKELIRRYAPAGASSALTGNWSSDLTRLQLAPKVINPSHSLANPTLLFLANRQLPDLWIHRFREKHVVFRSGVGVLLLKTLPAFERGLALMNAEERPW